jgi:hypothetical protein
VLCAAWIGLGLYPFLAPHAPIASDALVIEGWLKDDQLLQALGWAAGNGITTIYLTGGPIETGAWLSEWGTFAEMARARLLALDQAKPFNLVAVPAGKVKRDRTYASAVALKAHLQMPRGAFNLASEGPHTRRSRQIFQQVFGDGVEVGSLALTPLEYDSSDWWKTSEGVRSVISESIAYAYSLLVRLRQKEAE